MQRSLHNLDIVAIWMKDVIAKGHNRKMVLAGPLDFENGQQFCGITASKSWVSIEQQLLSKTPNTQYAMR